MPDLAIITSIAPPGIFSQAFYQYNLLQVFDDRIPVPPTNSAEPVTVGEAQGIMGKYIINDWLVRGGVVGHVFTLRLIGDKDQSTEIRFAVLPWWWVVLIVVLIVLLIYGASKAI